MKILKFREFIQKTPVITSVLSWPSSFAEIRKKLPEAISFLSWNSSHASQRKPKNKLEEAKKPSFIVYADPPKKQEKVPKGAKTLTNWHSEMTTQFKGKKSKVSKITHSTYYPEVHDHPEVIPGFIADVQKSREKALAEYSVKKAAADAKYKADTKKAKKGQYVHYPYVPHPDDSYSEWHPHVEAIHNYTGDYSAEINAHLRKAAGDTKIDVWGKFPKSDIDKLSAAFTPENRVRKSIETWSGVPGHIGDKLMKSKKKSYHHLAGFTSSSTKKRTAYDFAQNQEAYSDSYGDACHIIHYNIEKGAHAVSAVHASSHDENEVIIHHGVPVQYTGTTHYYPSTNGDMHLYVHHVTVKPGFVPLSQYPKAPKFKKAAKKKVAKKKVAKKGFYKASDVMWVNYSGNVVKQAPLKSELGKTSKKKVVKKKVTKKKVSKKKGTKKKISNQSDIKSKKKEWWDYDD